MTAIKEETIVWIGSIILGICLIGGLLFAARWFNEAATPIRLHEVKPGVYCASMVTADGVAIDCWKEDK